MLPEQGEELFERPGRVAEGIERHDATSLTQASLETFRGNARSGRGGPAGRLYQANLHKWVLRDIAHGAVAAELLFQVFERFLGAIHVTDELQIFTVDGS